MGYTVLIHLPNEDPVLAEMEELPPPNATYIICTEARRRDGKPLHYLTPEATAFIFPLSRISFIEILPGEAERGELLGFFREE
ncbi:MAG: hypothetical protein H5T60_13285 [Anaerolineae bacterium]|nr:hypothetical protein [Anaerolineae bacterium]